MAMTKESLREALDFLFKRLEKLVNAQHMSQMESMTPVTPDSHVFDSYQKMIGLEKDMKNLYNQPTVTTEELEGVESRLNSLEAVVAPTPLLA